MLTELALASGLSAILLKSAMAAWAALVILRWVDRRASAFSFAIALASIALVASILAGWDANGPSRSAWLASIGLSASWLLIYTRRWLALSPRDLYADDASQAKSLKKKKMRTAPVSSASPAKQPAAAGGKSYVEAISLPLGLLVVTLATLSQSWQADPTWQALISLSTVHQISHVLMWGLAVVCSIEVTFLCSPDTLKPKTGLFVHWSRLAHIGLVLFVLEMAICTAIFLSPTSGVEHELSAQLLARVFALSLIVLNFVAWMVPHRIAHFQKTGQATGWPSLALAAWLTVIALAVVAGLPSDWPWRLVSTN